jgi:hypothetical protein
MDAGRGTSRCSARPSHCLTRRLAGAQRGTLLPFSDRSVLLFIGGDAPGVSQRGHFAQGGKGIPRPIVLVRHAGSGPLELLGDDALALSKMDWNNDAL